MLFFPTICKSRNTLLRFVEMHYKFKSRNVRPRWGRGFWQTIFFYKHATPLGSNRMEKLKTWPWKGQTFIAKNNAGTFDRPQRGRMFMAGIQFNLQMLFLSIICKSKNTRLRFVEMHYKFKSRNVRPRWGRGFWPTIFFYKHSTPLGSNRMKNEIYQPNSPRGRGLQSIIFSRQKRGPDWSKYVQNPNLRKHDPGRVKRL